MIGKVHTYAMNISAYFMVGISIYTIICFFEYISSGPSFQIEQIYIQRNDRQIPANYDSEGRLIVKLGDKISMLYNSTNFNFGNAAIETIYRTVDKTEYQVNNIFKSVKNNNTEEENVQFLKKVDSESRSDIIKDRQKKNFIVSIDIPTILRPQCDGELYGRTAYRDDRNIFYFFAPKIHQSRKIAICIKE